jgi:hypothetical protein
MGLDRQCKQTNTIRAKDVVRVGPMGMAGYKARWYLG